MHDLNGSTDTKRANIQSTSSIIQDCRAFSIKMCLFAKNMLQFLSISARDYIESIYISRHIYHLTAYHGRCGLFIGSNTWNCTWNFLYNTVKTATHSFITLVPEQAQILTWLMWNDTYEHVICALDLSYNDTRPFGMTSTFREYDIWSQKIFLFPFTM